MDPVKRNTILKEIEHWRRSRLLPEQYCDFLRNLYMDSDQDTPRSDRGYRGGTDQGVLFRMDRFRRLLRVPVKQLFYIIGAVIICILLFIYFTSFHPLMQISVSLWIVLSCIAAGLLKRNAQPLQSVTLLGIGCMLALFFGMLLLQLHGLADTFWMVAVVALCGCIWLLAGLAARIALLHFAGWFVVALSMLGFINQAHQHPSWWIVQLYMLPWLVLLYRIGRRWLRAEDSGRISAGKVMLCAAGLYWFVPEAYGVFVLGTSRLLLVPVIMIKLAAAGVFGWGVWLRSKPSEEWMTHHDS